LGIANQEFIDKCERQGLIIEEFRIRVDSNEKIYTGKKITNFYPIKYIALNKYISLQVLSFYFRNYVRELLFIIESSIAFKNQPRTLG
jgi:hypothetical protein